MTLPWSPSSDLNPLPGWHGSVFVLSLPKIKQKPDNKTGANQMKEAMLSMRLFYRSRSHRQDRKLPSDLGRSFCVVWSFFLAAAWCVWGKQHSSSFSALGGGHEPLAWRGWPVPPQSVGLRERRELAAQQAGRRADFLVCWRDGWP